MLLGLSALGCVAGPMASGTLGRQTHSTASVVDASLDHQAWSKAADGRVELLEPKIVDEREGDAEESADRELDARRPSFAPLVQAHEAGSWVVDADGPVLELELRNACGLGFDYAFGPSAEPSGLEGQAQDLPAHTAVDQVIERGAWLHLWHEGLWLATVTSLAEGATMEIAGTCDAIRVEFEDSAGQARELAIHFELDADPSLAGSSTAIPEPEASPTHELVVERWGAGEGTWVEVELRNECPKSIEYTFGPAIDDDVERSSTLAGQGARIVEVPADWWLRYQVLDESWRGGATVGASGALVWIAANCVDFGVAHGEVLDDPR